MKLVIKKTINEYLSFKIFNFHCSKFKINRVLINFLNSFLYKKSSDVLDGLIFVCRNK